MLVAREGVEAEAQQALAVAGVDGGWEEVAEEGGAVVRFWMGMCAQVVVWAWR